MVERTKAAFIRNIFLMSVPISKTIRHQSFIEFRSSQEGFMLLYQSFNFFLDFQTCIYLLASGVPLFWVKAGPMLVCIL